jgi:hypothetical protein
MADAHVVGKSPPKSASVVPAAALALTVLLVLPPEVLLIVLREVTLSEVLAALLVRLLTMLPEDVPALLLLRPAVHILSLTAIIQPSIADIDRPIYHNPS